MYARTQGDGQAHTRTHAKMRTVHTRACIRVHTHTRACTRLNTHTHTCINVYTHTHTVQNESSSPDITLCLKGPSSCQSAPVLAGRVGGRGFGFVGFLGWVRVDAGAFDSLQTSQPITQVEAWRHCSPRRGEGLGKERREELEG